MTTLNDVIDKINKYMPTFVDTNSDIYQAIVSAIAQSMLNLYTAIYNQYNRYWTGESLNLEADRYSILYQNSTDEADIQSKLVNRYDILTKRGTETGIANDVSSIGGVPLASVDFYSGIEVGWILDNNYPETNVPKTNYLDAYKIAMLNIALNNCIGVALIGESRLGDTKRTIIEPMQSIFEKIIPIDVAIICE
jgi:hypothetical protein